MFKVTKEEKSLFKDGGIQKRGGRKRKIGIKSSLSGA
jgi:hypothetical protein